MELTDDGTAIGVSVLGNELCRYVYLPPEPAVESPRPYLHPVRTLGGVVVSAYRPADHVWHKGIAWSLPHVGGANFWGGPTFVRDAGYQQLANNGSMRHREFVSRSDGDEVRVVHTLDWVTQHGATVFTEQRTLRFALTASGWLLDFTTAAMNVSGAEIAIGSPTTEGRPNAGYGGLMWRGPESFTGGRVLLPTDDDPMGARAPWLAFQSEATLVFLDAPTNPGYPTMWFVRSHPYACACPAPFFAEEVPVAPGATLTLRYGVLIADGSPDPAKLAAEARF